MRVYSIDDMKGGWFVGGFAPTAFFTEACEVSLKIHPKGEQWDHHYHAVATETNLIVQGSMIIRGATLRKGDIFVLEPYEIADPVFLEDCQIVCVKVPGVANDKIVVERTT